MSDEQPEVNPDGPHRPIGDDKTLITSETEKKQKEEPKPKTPEKEI